MSERDRFRVLVLCTGNSARSQIAEALLVRQGGSRIAARSAGTRAASRVHPDALAVLERHGMRWDAAAPKTIADVDGEYDLVITVCDNARDACPYYPGAHAQVHWGLPDPTDVADPAERRRAFDETYDALDQSIRKLLELPLERLSGAELAERAKGAFADRQVG